MNGATYDRGMLIALDRRKPRARAIHEWLLAKSAGVALGKVPEATFVDAVVMASAAARGDAVYTSDREDLAILEGHFRGVRVLGV